ncbi:putative bifunctional diguanylate cyclase/phosphodiesterase [Frateuria aurantia]
MSSRTEAKQLSLARRLLPLGYSLGVIVMLIMVLSWGALQIQVTLGGFLDAESVWSKFQKQAVIELSEYAVSGHDENLKAFRDYAAILKSDAWARDALIDGQGDSRQVHSAFVQGHVLPSAVDGITVLLRWGAWTPWAGKAIAAWRQTDGCVQQLSALADQLELARQREPLPQQQLQKLREQILAVNSVIQPLTLVFSAQLANGAQTISRALYLGLMVIILLTFLLWMLMARRVVISIHDSQERYQQLFDNAHTGIVVVDPDSLSILDANRTVRMWTGRHPHWMTSHFLDDIFEDGHVDLGSLQPQRLKYSNPPGRMVELQRSSAQWRGRAVWQVVLRDITERLLMDEERRVAAEALAGIVEGVLIARPDRRIIFANPASTRITGYSQEQLRGSRLDSSRSQFDGEPLPGMIWNQLAAGENWTGEVLSRTADGQTYPEMLSLSAIRDEAGEVRRYVAVFSNITLTKDNQRRLEHLATHDSLTGLLNRVEFERCCRTALVDAAARHRAVVIMFIDLDGFKTVNDSYNHDVGDQLLMLVGERIRLQLGPAASVARIGGDEFTALIPDLDTREEVAGMASRLLSRLFEPVRVGEYEFTLSASIGIAGYPLDGLDSASLMVSADAAMYAAKMEERNTYRFYSPLMQADSRRRLRLATELRAALVANEFFMVYQPSVELKTGRIVAVEALLRWQHPERGCVMPGDFIEAAEQMGLIRRVDEWVLRMVCAQIARWDRAGVPPIRLAVNLSAHGFSQEGFVESLQRLIQQHGFEPSRLMIEITERVMLRLGEDTERAMHALHQLGVGVAIDDFGTGYSSMAYLKLPAIEYLKLDRSFVSGVPTKTDDVAIVEALLGIARSLGLHTIAEGVENEAQHQFMLRSGCDEGQGYYYAYPLDAEEIERLLCRDPGHQPSPLRLVASLGGKDSAAE